MPRRTNRDESAPEPLPEKHLLLRPEPPLIPGQRQWLSPTEWENRQARRETRTRERTAERERQRILAEVSDWDHCMVPGCERLTEFSGLAFTRNARDPDWSLPLCERHLTIAWNMVERNDDKSITHTIYASMVERRMAIIEANKEKEKRDFLAVTDGHIYLIRQNGLIKVGWTRRLRSRLREYGAGVEVLCYYKATRDEETQLHRQLTPYRAKGREWYTDADMLRDLAASIIAKHGAPDIDLYWTEPKEVIKLRRR